MIKFNEVTWYSKLAAIIFFLGIFPILTFYIGMKYEEVKNVNDIQVIQNAPTSLEKQTITTLTEGCVENDIKRTCILKMNGDKFYTFYYNGETKIEVYKDNSHQQTIIQSNGKIDPGTINGFMVAMDVNFDGLDDLGIKTCEGVTGNVCYDIYLFNSKTGEFEYSTEFTSAGGFPDASSQEIRSHWNSGCAGGCYSEKVYKVVNNKPVLILDVDQDFDDQKQVFIKVTKELKNGAFVTSTSTVAY